MTPTIRPTKDAARRRLQALADDLAAAKARLEDARGVGDVLNTDVDEALEAIGRVALDVDDALEDAGGHA